ncbi:hypothetical protein TNCV_2617571 [Trichonephila clavipes]|nr:hypothetical protein TNCV_2617571 [Trichonephila clavipes]
MESLSGQSFVPSNLGHVDDEEMIPTARGHDQQISPQQRMFEFVDDPVSQNITGLPQSNSPIVSCVASNSTEKHQPT